MQLGTKPCIMNTVVLLSKGQFDVRTHFLMTNAVIKSRDLCVVVRVCMRITEHTHAFDIAMPSSKQL